MPLEKLEYLFSSASEDRDWDVDKPCLMVKRVKTGFVLSIPNLTRICVM